MADTPETRTGEALEQSNSSLNRSGLIVAAMTFLSRILGLAREVVFAALFGDGQSADAFFVAFKIPNFLRRLFAEGAFAQAFVPVLSEYRKKRSMAEVKLLLDHVAGRLGLILAIITVLGVVGAAGLASLFGFGYRDDPDKFALLVDLLRITFPYILLISLTGFTGSVLNSYGRFAVPAVTPIFLNICLIGAAVLISPLMDPPVMALAWGVLLAGLVQLMFQLPFLAHLKLVPRPRLRPQHPGVQRILLLMLPIMLSVSVNQISLMIDTIMATTQEEGSVSWLYYADRLMELPLGIFGVAIATVILPSLSRIVAGDEQAAFSKTLDWGLRVVTVLGLPASLALIVLAEPIVTTLYQRGEFGVGSVMPTVLALRAYTLGILAFMAVKVLSSAYFSRQDTKTPVRFAVVAVSVNVIMNFVLIGPLGHVGLALATSLSALTNAGLLLWGLLKGGFYQPAARWGVYLLQMLLALTGMGLLLWWLTPPLSTWLAWGDIARVFNLLWLCLLGGAVYAGLLLLLGLRPADLRH